MSVAIRAAHIPAAAWPVEAPRSRATTTGGLRVLQVISSLEYGGAERQVVQLANALPGAGCETSICSLSPCNPLAGQLERPSCLHVVEKRWKYDAGVIWRAARLMRRLRINVAHAWLFDAEMVTRLAARLAGVPVVISSERNSDYRFPLVHYCGLRLTRSWFDALVANSQAGKRFNIEQLAIAPERIHVIHNGVDTRRFRPSPGEALRAEWGAGRDDLIIGMVASFKRQKNHGAFFRMARRVLERRPEAWFWCVGEPLRDNLQGAEDYHREMHGLVQSLGVSERVRFLGSRADMPEVYSAMDISVLTSQREGTPNVLLESMACGVPVVATDVADNAYVVPDGRAGFLARLDDEDALVDRVLRLASDAGLRQRMGSAARSWVESDFSIAALTGRMAGVYAQCLMRKTGGRPS